MEFRTIYITTKNEDEALEIGETLVEERLVACANIIPKIRSIYRWQGNIEKDEESVLLLKTRSDLSAKVISRVKSMHSYTVPCIVSWKIQEGNEEYLEWIRTETIK
ncbi:divalent cation tolerance protein, CutA1 family [Leptospira inadai serovar Lyme str. 10]|uniref:Divalent cation tolerance protein, CutA1 family n=2 Tax=Leptospira inadai serovar Lyme TaxID=293084 RepID=V6HH56_9LEPT|nr:divalent-cation tolerance protein CutA [Leptospira inadai]EQA35465.1 divalent cation tolerance protein, CutA1 family [Leptospira inadai serovar Lyme str. 10]PNV72448.1 divalent-cation tolerance protein CutA [Leptospira inadai serovar Lyme]